ncbi:MAG: HEAT repeat domain-containing protein, partial [Planctomycetota bacterium]|nr:HEAT repeat domain-containing protein [Planctomycetota bacterium]
MGVQIAPLQPTLQDPLETIARYEDARTDGDGLLQALLQRGSPKTRERAAVALGRLDPQVFGASATEGLIVALEDDSSGVRAAAAFALGQRADKSAAAALLAHWNDPDAGVRARIVEAASRIDDASLRARILTSLDDPDSNVRALAALAPSRFPPLAPDAPLTDAALVEYLMRNEKGTKPAPDVEIRWRGSYALSRRKAVRARALFIAGASAIDPRERIYACQGMGAVGSDDASRKALVTLLADTDWRVACEAANALGKQSFQGAFDALAVATHHASPHVRRCAYEALGAFRDSKIEARAVFERAR